MIEDGRLYLQKEGVLPENVFFTNTFPRQC